MNQQQALARLRKVLGGSAFIRIDRKALVGEERQAMRTKSIALRQQLNDAEAARVARMHALLSSDAEYQRLKAERERLKAEHEHASYYAHHDRITVGTSGRLFNSIKGGGETLAEVVEKIEGKSA